MASKRTYVILCDVVGYISGAVIYYRNKVKYLCSRDWTVKILPIRRGEIYVEGLDAHLVGVFPFLREHPNEFSAEQLSKKIDQMSDAVGNVEGFCVVETGTDWSSYWGELLAQRLHARHFIYFLDESTDKVQNYLDFFYFKLRRKELSCISKSTARKMFEGMSTVSQSELRSFSAYCTNSIQDFDNAFSRHIKQHEFNIGSIGRLDKPYVTKMLTDINAFANEYPRLDIQVVLFGGADRNTVKKIRRFVSRSDNITLMVSGYMWPLPKKTLEMMDVFVSAAGSASVSAKYLGIPTVALDVLGNGAIGFVGEEDYNRDHLYRDQENESPDNLQPYLAKVLSGTVVKRNTDYDECLLWNQICTYFDSLANELTTNEQYAYFDIRKLPLTKHQRIKKIYMRLFGERALFAAKRAIFDA